MDKPDTKENLTKININCSVFVKLTEKGFIHWQTKENEIFERMELYKNPLEYYQKKADNNGFVKFQIWHFMQIFGNSIKILDNTIFSTDIYFYEKELEQIN